MEFIIDRFEGEEAIIEVAIGEFVSIPKILLPISAKEGDVINITINENSTKKRKEHITSLMNDLFED